MTDHKEKARAWLFDYGGSSGFSVSVRDQLAGWMEKADLWDRTVNIGGIFTTFDSKVSAKFVKTYTQRLEALTQIWNSLEKMALYADQWAAELNEKEWAEDLVKALREAIE